MLSSDSGEDGGLEVQRFGHVTGDGTPLFRGAALASRT